MRSIPASTTFLGTMLLVVPVAAADVTTSAEKRLNNLVFELLAAASDSKTGETFRFTRSKPGWIFVSTATVGMGKVTITLDDQPAAEAVIAHEGPGGNTDEAFRHIAPGEHRLRVTCAGDARVDKLIVRAVPELMHCGLGFNSSIKGYGIYDLEFLKRDLLPNITTLVVPHSIQLEPLVIDNWHRQGKRFVAEVGINGQAKTAEDHAKYWSDFYEKAPWLDGILINEFIVNAETYRLESVSPERRARVEKEQANYQRYEQALKLVRADPRYRDKALLTYFGGSGKKLNQQVIGESFVRTLIDTGCQIALERYLHEMSSEEKSRQALETFVDGIADWEAKQPGAKEHMTIAFGLFSMPPGGINKQPNVDYHVWMDQQMNAVANRPELAGISGLNWWTTILADEETVRFVGRLYRHYAIDGRSDMLTHDPLFLAHLTNADFERGTEGWTLHAAEPGTIEPKSFPRYGRIEGRYMGLGRPADPEHIGDTFLWMKRSEKGPNTFSQTIKKLEPGRLYSMKMFTCDYQDLAQPQKKTEADAHKFVGRATLDGVELDTKRSFIEAYSSNPEPPIPVWITYHWKVFRAKSATAELTVSDWPDDSGPEGPFGLEQTFNFVEIQPYYE